MKRKIRVEASYSGVLPVASYSNLRPGFSASMEFENEFRDDAEVELAIEGAQQKLNEICYRAFESEAVKARVLKVQEDLKSVRFHDVDGEKFPSISSITSYDKDFFVGDEDLKIYCAQGNIIDAEIRYFVRSGLKTYLESKDILECTADRFILKSKPLSSGKFLALSGWNFRGFLEKYPIQNLESMEKVIHSKRHRIAGTPDLKGVYNGLKTLISIKRTKSETDNLIQEAGYSLCDTLEDVEQFMVIEMKSEEDGGNKQGFSKPILTTDVARYRELFLRKRQEFLKIYGV